MGRPGVGNPGNKGGGRKSAYQEKADADFLWNLFTKEFTKKELEKLYDENRKSIRGVWVKKLLAGNEKFIQQVVHKLFQDK